MFPSKLNLRAHLALSALTLALSAAPSRAQAYKLNGRVFSPDQLPLKIMLVGQPPQGLSLGTLERELQAALETWSQVPCSSLRLEYAGHATTREQVPQDHIPISFVSPGQDSCLPQGTTLLGLTASLCDPSHQVAIVFNRDDFDWGLTPNYLQQLVPALAPRDKLGVDLRSAFTHELGHLIGLSHPDDAPDPQPITLATMSKRYLLDGGQATLAADDREGLCTLYPNPAGAQSCDTDEQCRQQLNDPGASCISAANGALKLCEEERADIGSYCAQDLLICPERCLLTSLNVGTGYCTTSCDEANPCPQGYQCAPDPFELTQDICQLEAPASDPDTGGCAQNKRASPASPGWPISALALMLLLGVVKRTSWTWPRPRSA